MIQDFKIIRSDKVNRKKDYIDVDSKKIIIKSIQEVYKYVTIISKPSNLNRTIYYLCFSDKPFNQDSIKTGIDGFGTYRINIEIIFYFLGLEKDSNVLLELYEKDKANIDDVDINYTVYQIIC